MMDIELERSRLLIERFGRRSQAELVHSLAEGASRFFAAGIDVRSRVVASLRRCASQETVELFRRLTQDFEPSLPALEVEIDSLYRVLRGCAAAHDEQGYRDTLRQLRTLQTSAADQMAAYFNAHRQFDIADATAAMNRAQALLDEYKNASADDGTGR